MATYSTTGASKFVQGPNASKIASPSQREPTPADLLKKDQIVDKNKKFKIGEKSEASGTVFGSFGLQYPSAGIETLRSDGVTIVNLAPECRVFVCGGEITKDVKSVSVNFTSDNVSQCEIQLANPRGKYCISPTDLIYGDDKKPMWREDKSIQATYEYDWLKKQIPGSWTLGEQSTKNVNKESKVKKLGKKLLGDQVGSTLNAVLDHVNGKNKSKGQGFTQMVYEIKQMSNYPKAVGETIFDYRDPVYVFFKGRFSSYWYFGFSGIISSIDNQLVYGSTQSITLQCHDIIGILKRKKFTQQGTILSAGVLESSLAQSSESRKFNIFSDVAGNFSQVVKQILFVADDRYWNNVINSHFYFSEKCSLKGIKKQTSSADTTTKTVKEETETAVPGIAPYEKKEQYFQEFYNYHPFNIEHHDKDNIVRDNKGKQFREFLLVDTEDVYNDTNVETIVKYDITFRVLSTKFTSEDQATKSLEEIAKAMDKYAENGITWTIVGHTEMNVPKYGEQSLVWDKNNKYNNIDGGKAFCEYRSGTYNEALDCVDVKEGTYGCKEGAGVTLSKNRCVAVLKLLLKAYGDKYKRIVPLINDMLSNNSGKVISKGSSEPITINKEVKLRSAFSSLEQMCNTDGGVCIQNVGKGYTDKQINILNRRIEFVPSSSSVKIKVEPEGESDSEAYVKDPHKLKFSPMTDIYFQLNEIKVEDFDPQNLNVFYDTSVRYWVKGAGTSIDVPNLYNTTKTGWKHTHGFGVCGIHPALSYTFIDNFDILPSVYFAAKTHDKHIDGTTLNPLDIIREQIYGVGTELGVYNKKNSLGTQKNYFRPRIFLVLPKKFSKDIDVHGFTFAQLTLEKQQAISTWDLVAKLILDYEYTVYTSPMGDLFIEPLMHDFHPLDFSDNIDERSICPRVYNTSKKRYEYKGVDVYFRTYINTNEKQIIGYRKDKAFKFNTQANHPFFISNKDIKRVTETLKPENLVSHVILQGSITGGNGLYENMVSSLEAGSSAVSWLNFKSKIEAIDNGDGTSTIKSKNFDPKKKDNSIFEENAGFYIANGFPTFLADKDSAANSTKTYYQNKKKDLENKYYYRIYNDFMNNKMSLTVQNIIEQATTSLQKMGANNVQTLYNESILSLVTCFSKKKDYVDPDVNGDLVSDGKQGLNGQQLTVLKNLSPQFYEIYEYVGLKQIKSNQSMSIQSSNKLVSASTPKLLSILKNHNIKNLTGENGLLSLTLNKISYGSADITLDTSKTESQLIDELLVNNASDTSKEYGSASSICLQELSILSECSILEQSGNSYKEISDINIELFTIQKKLKSDVSIGYVTRGDLKKYEYLQLYDPSRDYFTKYGWNPGPTVINKYINNGAEAEMYCKVLFDKINSKVYEINCDLIGRPELFLNRPYYIEQQQAIGLLNNYTISFAINSSFSSNTKLSFIRRNAITYGYTAGNLDKVISISGEKADDAHTNAWFNTKALSYLKSIYRGEVTEKRYGALDSIISKSTALGPVGTLAGGGAQAALNKFKKSKKEKAAKEVVPDGIYVAHDWIGHVDYNNKFQGGNYQIFYEKVTAEVTGDPKYTSKLGDQVITQQQAAYIAQCNNELHKAFMILANLELQIKFSQKSIVERTKIINETQNSIDTLMDEYATEYNAEYVSAEILNSIMRQANELGNVQVRARASLSSEREALNTNLENYSTLIYNIYGVAGSYNVSTSKRQVNTTTTASDKGLMNKLYKAIPETDIAKKSLRSKYEVIDDLSLTNSGESLTFSGRVDGVPLYIVYVGPKVDNTAKATGNIA